LKTWAALVACVEEIRAERAVIRDEAEALERRLFGASRNGATEVPSANAG
jgi:hypothetical protein